MTTSPFDGAPNAPCQVQLPSLWFGLGCKLQGAQGMLLLSMHPLQRTTPSCRSHTHTRTPSHRTRCLSKLTSLPTGTDLLLCVASVDRLDPGDPVEVGRHRDWQIETLQAGRDRRDQHLVQQPEVPVHPVARRRRQHCPAVCAQRRRIDKIVTRGSVRGPSSQS